MMNSSTAPRVDIVDVTVFLAELALLAALAVAGARLGSGYGAVVLALASPVCAVAVWATWLAPRTRQRLSNRWRLAAKLALFLAASALLAASGLVGWAVALLIAGGTVTTAGELRSRHV